MCDYFAPPMNWMKYERRVVPYRLGDSFAYVMEKGRRQYAELCSGAGKI